MNHKPSYIKYAPSWILYLFLWILAQLPYKLIILLGKLIGQLLKLVLGSRNKVITKNLEICFPSLSQSETLHLKNKHLIELGIMFTQTLKSFLGTTDKIEHCAEINGMQHIQECLDNNQGVLLVAGHFTALDVGGKILCKKFPIAGMYREHKHPLTEYVVRKSRLKYASKMFKREALRPIIKHLRSGGILWYAPDQNYRRGQSVFVPFFGRKASTIIATHQMAKLSKCKVLFFHVQRNDQKPFYSLSISPPMENFPSQDATEDTAKVNKGIEEMVVRNPEQYLWVHKRFKTVEDGQTNPYKK